MLCGSILLLAHVGCQIEALWRRIEPPAEIPASRDRSIFNHQSPDRQIAQCLNSLLIPCFWTHLSRKPAIHAAFHTRRKKFPVIFPVLREFDPDGFGTEC